MLPSPQIMSGRGKRKSIRQRTPKVPYTGIEGEPTIQRRRVAATPQSTDADESLFAGPPAGPANPAPHVVSEMPSTSGNTVTTAMLLEAMANLTAVNQQLAQTQKASAKVQEGILSELAALKAANAARAQPPPSVSRPIVTSLEYTLAGEHQSTLGRQVPYDLASIVMPTIPNIPVPPTPVMAATSGSYSTHTTPVGAFVSKSVKLAIQNKSFVDFRELLEVSDPYSSDDEMQLVNSKKGPIFKKKKKLTQADDLIWVEWVKAWNVYVALNSKFHAIFEPSLPQNMAKHFEVVQALQERGKDWTTYDQKFRRTLADPEQSYKVSWGGILSEEQNDARHSADRTVHPYQNRVSQFSSGPSGPSIKKEKTKIPQNEDRVPKDWCYNYHNRSGSCTRKKCRHSHICYKCAVPGHPAFSCSFRKNSSVPSPAQTKGGK